MKGGMFYMVESNAAKSASMWSQKAAIFACVAVLAAFVAPALYIQDVPNVLTEDQIQESVQKAVALQMDNMNFNVSDGPKTIAIYENIFEEDAWEAQSEMLAIDEIEDDNYENLYDFMTNTIEDDGMDLSIEDERDIDEVVIQDVTFSNMDVDDKDATVELELKVYYENSDGESRKKYITATAIIEDDEVEDLDFIETD